MDKQHLTSEYILDLFAVGFKRIEFFEILTKHLKYSYLTLEHEKKVWKKAVQLYRMKHKLPSLGVVQVELRRDDDAVDFIQEIKDKDVEDAMSVINAFQNFIKESMFVEVFESAGDLYNRGEEDAAFKEFTAGAEAIMNFSIKDKVFEKVFGNFDERDNKRITEQDEHNKVPFSIDKIDEWTFGGAEAGETILVTGESGSGKSQFLIHLAINVARMGGKVAFFQVEGTKKQVMTRLDAAWTGQLYHSVKKGEIDLKAYTSLKRVLKKIKGEIYVEAFERFGDVTTTEIQNSYKEMEKLYGKGFKLIIIDYLELIEPDDGIRYTPNMERFRQGKIAKWMKELAMDTENVVATVTQASNLPSELKKDPNFVMTREYLSEDKGKIRAFDFHFTLNQTYDEMKARHEFTEERAPRMRIFGDKLREYEGGKIATIINNFKRARFYDRKATIETIIDFEEEDE